MDLLTLFLGFAKMQTSIWILKRVKFGQNGLKQFQCFWPERNIHETLLVIQSFHNVTICWKISAVCMLSVFYILFL